MKFLHRGLGNAADQPTGVRLKTVRGEFKPAAMKKARAHDVPLKVLTAALLAIAAPVMAADIEYIGTSDNLHPWDDGASWAGGVVPGPTDRAVFSGTLNSIYPVADPFGAVWITSTSGLTRFNKNPNSPAVTIHGVDGIGAQVDSSNEISFFSKVNLAGDIAIRATNSAGGGFDMVGGFGGLPSKGIDLGAHTLTFDTVNAANFTKLRSAYPVIGTGNVVKTGNGWLEVTANNLLYTGSTAILGGTMRLAGAASLANSSNVQVNGTLDISGTTSGTDMNTLTGNGNIELGARNLRLAADGNAFSGVINGAGKLILDNGTTTLTGANTYSGGTDLKQGRVNVGHTSALGTGDLAMDDGTTLGFVADGLTLANNIRLTGLNDPVIDTGSFSETLSGAISGTGLLTKEGSGTLTFAGANNYSGATNVAAGTLRAGMTNTFSAVSAHTVAAGATLDLAGFNQTVPSMTNSGTVSLRGAAPGTVLTVVGDYAGNGGTLELATTLGDDSSPTDRLVVAGDTSGATNVRVIKAGGTGAPTVEGTKLVEVGGVSAGTFSLQSDYVFQGQPAVVNGAYAYQLHKNGVSTPADGDWYLRSSLDTPVDPPVPPVPSVPSDPSTPAEPVTPSAPTVPIYQPGVPVYESYANILQSFNALGTLQQRVGNRAWATAPGNAANVGTPANGAIEGNGVWARMEASHGSFDPKESTSRANYDLDTWRLQVGVDKLLHKAAEGSLIAGLSAHYGTISAGIDSIFGNGKISTTGYGLGAATTWYGNSGFYVDGQAQATWYDSDLSSRMPGVGMLARGNNAFGYGLSLETGQRITLDPKWSVTPQAQLAYSSVDFDRFTDPFGALVSLDRSNNLTGRLGVALNYQNETRDAGGVINRSNVYGIANVYYDFMDGSKTDVAGTKLTSKNEPLWAGVGIGGSYNWARDKYSLYGETSINTSMANFGDSYAVAAMVGLRARW